MSTSEQHLRFQTTALEHENAVLTQKLASAGDGALAAPGAASSRKRKSSVSASKPSKPAKRLREIDLFDAWQDHADGATGMDQTTEKMLVQIYALQRCIAPDVETAPSDIITRLAQSTTTFCELLRRSMPSAATSKTDKDFLNVAAKTLSLFFTAYSRLTDADIAGAATHSLLRLFDHLMHSLAAHASPPATTHSPPHPVPAILLHTFLTHIDSLIPTNPHPPKATATALATTSAWITNRLLSRAGALLRPAALLPSPAPLATQIAATLSAPHAPAVRAAHREGTLLVPLLAAALRTHARLHAPDTLQARKEALEGTLLRGVFGEVEMPWLGARAALADAPVEEDVGEGGFVEKLWGVVGWDVLARTWGVEETAGGAEEEL